MSQQFPRGNCLLPSAAATTGREHPKKVWNNPNDRKTGHTSKCCVHMATLLKIYIYMYFKILCARARQSCHGGGISPGNLTCPEQTNRGCLHRITPSAASGTPSLPLISTSLSLLQGSSPPLLHRGFASQRKGAKDIPKTS